jgi:outer membrane protein TolC
MTRSTGLLLYVIFAATRPAAADLPDGAADAGPLPEAAPAPRRLSLEECLRMAMAENAELLAAEEAEDVARARLVATGAALLPAVTVKTEETRGRADEAGGTPSFVERVQGVQATQTLFAGGGIWAARRRAGLESRAGRLEAERLRRQVRHRVEEAFWRTAALTEACDVYREALAGLGELLEKAARHELGDSPRARIELLSVRAQAREAEALLAETGAERAEWAARLADLMGRREADPPEPAASLDAVRVEADEAECAALARRHRPETAAAELDGETAQWREREGRARLLPRADASGFYGRSGAAFDRTDPFRYRTDWNAGVKVTWPLWGSTAGASSQKQRTSPRLGESTRTDTETLGASVTLGDALGLRADAIEAGRRRRSEDRRVARARRDVETDARTACRRAEAAWRRAESAAAREEEAVQSWKETRSLAAEDRAHLGDEAAARLRIASAKAARAQARGHYLAAVSDLNRAVGLPDRFRAAAAP